MDKPGDMETAIKSRELDEPAIGAVVAGGGVLPPNPARFSVVAPLSPVKKKMELSHWPDFSRLARIRPIPSSTAATIAA